MSTKKKITWICLVGLALGIKIFSLFPGAVESVYSTGLYPYISRLQRLLFGWLPFSIGDIFYALIILRLIYGLFRVIRTLVKRQATMGWWLTGLRRSIFICLLVYVSFNLLWGLNYDRKDIGDQLQLDVRPYSTTELTSLVKLMNDRLYAMDSLGRVGRQDLYHRSYLFDASVHAYGRLASDDPLFTYHTPSVKTSLFGVVGDYLGYSGYYNPFSGEAQVNTTVPVFTQPFTTCHEMGHQLGYAKENEANLAGYFAASHSNLPTFHYSAYFEIYVYAIRELYLRDSTLAVPFRNRLGPGVKADGRTLREFDRKYENPFEPIIRRLYGNYLQANHQPQGIKTYNEVIAWLIAYANKNGWSAI